MARLTEDLLVLARVESGEESSICNRMLRGS